MQCLSNLYISLTIYYMFNFNKSVGDTVRIAIKPKELSFSPVQYANYSIVKKVKFWNKYKYTIKNDSGVRIVQSYS